jgi:type I restriction enzyme R subunit
VNEWCEVWFRNRMNPTGGEHKKLNSILDRVVEQYNVRKEEEQGLFKSQLASFRNLYLFLSQIIPYQDSELEKLYTFSRYLLTKLPRSQDGPAIKIDDEVQLKYYRLEKISEGAIDLKAGEATPLLGPREVGTGQADDEVQLSTLVEKLNERFGTEFTLADQLFFDQVRETAVANEQLRQSAKVNSIENFEPVFKKQLENLFIERMEDNEEIFMRLMNDSSFREMAAQYLMQTVYQQINQGAG